MNAFFRRLPLPVKLILMAILPLILLVYFTFSIYREKSEKLDIIDNYLTRIATSANLSSTISALQTERRYSFAYVLNGEREIEMRQNRIRTDSAIRKLAADTSQRNFLKFTMLDSLSKVRDSINVGAFNPLAVSNYYITTLFRLNTLNVISGGNISFLQPVMGDLQGQKLLSEMITYLGILRSNIYYALSMNQPAQQTAEASRSLYEIYKSYVIEFNVKASPEAISSYERIEQNTDLQPTLIYIEKLLNQGVFDQKYNTEQFSDVSARALDELITLQKSLLIKSQNGVQQIYYNERASRTRSLIFLLLSIALVITLMLYTIATISRALTNLNTAATSLSRGATGLQIIPESNDVIGRLASSIIRIDENNKSLSKAADAIGSGNFDVDIRPRSEEDILGNAIVRMKEGLQEYSRENENKIWVNSGNVALNEALHGDQNLSQLSSNALTTIANYVGTEVGLLYVATESHLEYGAGYAVNDLSTIPARVNFGETLIGQAAKEKRIIQLGRIPDGFIKVRSGTGEAPPEHLLIIPLVHNEQVEGVIELGSFQPFEDRELSFLNQVAPTIAIALQTTKSRLKLKELFEQTHAQSEALQSQHGELENINAELEAQTEKLQASEEELKVQQEELLQANAELEERSRLLEERNQLIVERNIEIQQKAEELAISTKYKSEFLANMSHELRTPLNSVLLLSRLLVENNESNLTKDQIEYAQVIQSSGQGLLSLIDEILDLSKIEAGKMDLEFGSVFISEIVNDMKALFTPMAREKGLDLVIDVDPNLPSQMETDKLRLEQVLRNLLSNAIKFTSKGSVQLTLTPDGANANYVAFRVKDTGIGIAKEKQGLIFEAFQQADGSTKRKFGGTGLGLSISRELTKLLGGELTVSSEEGKGSEFTASIPLNRDLAKKEVAEEMSFEELSLPPSRGFRTTTIPENLPDDREKMEKNDKTILIIEDDTGFAKALLDFTHQRGYKGLVAVRGDEGIELARKYKPQGILLDIQLPVKDGWEVMDELKKDPQTRHIPVHIMSSLEAKKESRIKGAVDFISKPMAFEQMQEVFKKIEQVISKESKKVLILEENPQHAKALAYFLETFNVGIEISDTVDKGVNALKKNEVDCVILDMGIPDQSTYQALEALKKEAGMENLPIIIFTGKALSKTEEMKIRQYADSIVIKTAQSYQRILDEVSLFLHLVEETKEGDKKPSKYKRLGAMNEVLSGKKILVADDDVRNIFSLTKALELHDMAVFSAVDGKEALKQLEEHPDMDVVLMDIMMPEMDGYEATRKIREKYQFKNLPVIAVTAKAMTGDREKCIQAGASDYISKPVDIDQLLSLLRVWLYDKRI